jgi:hypothetical protein
MIKRKIEKPTPQSGCAPRTIFLAQKEAVTPVIEYV